MAMGRKRASVRREEILAATVDEIEATGLRALRVADVAGRLGLSASLVIYHFQTKEALVAAAFAHAGESDLNRAREIVDTDAPATARLSDLLAWYLPSGSTRAWTIWMDAWSSALFDAEIQSTLTVLDREWQDVFARVIADGVATGEFALDGEDPGEPAAVAATRLLAYLDGLSVRLMVGPGEEERATMLAWVEEFADTLLARDAASAAPGGRAPGESLPPHS
ncbi:TetR/AcrR family transcriptional regulator [Brevibacterium casei]|nr:TetR/AcrR family transcriptional regulator [Brevibacterium casei]MCT1549282.1 TetR family transcriptional regulator [Brevibacterium casei]MCT1559051.1 TetR family transcriptional regulator [Brevibacterium casei]MCT2206841.1 TetR family transcriptional regulator [Brevibacterium casei]